MNITFGTELDLMLARKKKLAVFYRGSKECFDETGGQNFDMYVEKGVFKKKRFFLDSPANGRTIYSLYFYPDESWRADLYFALKKSIFESGWDDSKEKIERLLLSSD
jgi:hypothetical protein